MAYMQKGVTYNRRYVMESGLSVTANIWMTAIVFYTVLFPVGGVNHACGETGVTVDLPQPRYESSVSVEQALRERRSVRTYRDDALSLNDVSQILWAAQGITHERGLRTAPSGGALYPLELYLFVGNVDGLDRGIYNYRPQGHQLVRVQDGDRRSDLCDATLNQTYVKDAPAAFVFTAIYERITKKYGDRGIRYAHMEAGHAAQNVYLQAGALNLNTVVVGAFQDDEVKKVLELDSNENPLYIMPLGKKPDR